jgi:CRP/FNR family transcriptional regulator
MTMRDCETLSSIPFFREVGEEISCFILDYASHKHLPKGNYLFMADEVCTHLFIIKEGLIEIAQLSEEGKKIVLHHAMRGAFLGDTILFNVGTYGAYAYTLEDSEFLSIDKKSFEGIIHAYPEIGIKMLGDFGERIERLKSLVAEIALNDVRKRILRLLLELAENEKKGCVSRAGVDYRNSFVLTKVPTQDQMAHRIGTVREVLCKGLHKLEKDNIIRVKRGNIVIHNLRKLREMVLEDKKDNLFPIILPMRREELTEVIS